VNYKIESILLVLQYTTNMKKSKRRASKKASKKHHKHPRNSDDVKGPIFTTSFGGTITDVGGPIPSIFQKEPKEMVEKRKMVGSNPIDISKRKVRLISSAPYELTTEPQFYHPTRPNWSASTDKVRHEQLEQEYFDEWRKQIQTCYEENQVPPFENNINVWRQMWRTIEQSNVILLIVDIRNPLLHIPPSLVDDVVNHQKKRLIIVLTKIDLVSTSFTQMWIRYLKETFPQVEDVLPFTKQPVEDYTLAVRGGVASRMLRL